MYVDEELASSEQKVKEDVYYEHFNEFHFADLPTILSIMLTETKPGQFPDGFL